jgi:cytochrome c oxidase subunit 3/cytochrome o ubiquinol oxidase subunit 3
VSASSHAAAAHTATHGAEHATTTGLDHRKMLWWAFLGSDCMFFGSLIATYLVYKGRDGVGPTPHRSVLHEGILNIPLTSVSAFVLLMSSLAMVLALSGINAGDMRKFRVWILATAVLGAGFVGFQIFEFTEFYYKGLSLQGNLFGATFFTLTGFHGAHVSVGVLWLLSLFYWSFSGQLTQANALNVEIAGLYWHFVDVVWIAIFAIVYLIP